MSYRSFSLVVMLVVALGTVVLADPPTVSIQQQATLDQFVDPVFGGEPITWGVLVTVNVNCGGEDPTQFELNVGVRQGDLAAETGGTFFDTTGGRQEVTVEVYGPFEPGYASATAALSCGGLLEGLQVGETIKISEP
jgi:hypothetical protein